MATVSVRNFTRYQVPRFPYERIARTVVPGWDVSLAFVGPSKAKALNEALRDKTYTPNVLSYEAGKRSGEIIICPTIAKQQSPEYGLTTDDFILLLFIHALLHLKGLPHGATMEARERKLVAKFARGSVNQYKNATKNSDRHRHRNLSGKDGRPRRAA
ncbi:MAG TPA: rRNA maturation RNase YbeY [Candidatus Paceibacterota bacterium]|nr:rRNA maturation RNase YbeY [Candidatus Paceibacterota bacterium]